MPHLPEVRSRAAHVSPVLKSAMLRGRDPANRAWLAAVLLLLLWVPLLTGLQFPSKMDERDYHVPNVRSYVGHFPTLAEMRETDLAMGPLFHGFLGGLARWTGTELPSLRMWMLVFGGIAFGLYVSACRQVPGIDWRSATLALAAFPYFGTSYFVVMTDFPAFLALAGAWWAQLRFIRTGREGSLWLAGVAGLLACLIRQNFIFAPGMFLLFFLARGRNLPGGHEAVGIVAWRRLPALVLPFLATAFLYWLWGGLLPAAYAARDTFRLDAKLYSLAFVSVGANLGYYLLPATVVLAVTRRFPISRWIPLVLSAAGITLFSYLVRGPQLVTTFGTYLHALTFLRMHVGIAASLLIFGLSILSFMIFAMNAWQWVRDPQPGRESRLLLGALLVGGLVALSFGMFRIYERHILPVFALSAMILFGVTASEQRRLLRAGKAGVILFCGVHAILYAVSVYELLP